MNKTGNHSLIYNDKSRTGVEKSSAQQQETPVELEALLRILGLSAPGPRPAFPDPARLEMNVINAKDTLEKAVDQLHHDNA